MRADQTYRTFIPLAALVLAMVGCAGQGASPDDETIDRMRERIDRGIGAVAAYDGGKVGYATDSFDGSHRSTTCMELTTESTSVDPDRFQIITGQITDVAGRCTLGDWFIVDDAVVYAPTASDVGGYSCHAHAWAHVHPAVLDEVVGDMDMKADPEPFYKLLDAVTHVIDDSPSQLVVELSVDALVDARPDMDRDALSGASADGSFLFGDDGALKEISYTIANDGVSVTTTQYFEATGEPPVVEVPEAHCLEPERPALTTLGDFQTFVGLGQLNR